MAVAVLFSKFRFCAVRLGALALFLESLDNLACAPAVLLASADLRRQVTAHLAGSCNSVMIAL